MAIVKKSLCSAVALAIAGFYLPAFAQSAAPAVSAGSATLEEVIVTARRTEERIQDVPASLNVVTAESVDNLKLTEFTDLQAVVPGLSLDQDGSGTQTSASLRGVTFDARSTAPPTVAMYLNDAPVQSLYLYDSLFDVGQVEVLRGPQGTTRGVSAPSGAITVTSHKADTAGWGGYVKGLMTDEGGTNGQAAVNVPVIPDRFAVRLAGVADVTEANSVQSLHSQQDPEQDTKAARLSALYEATEDVTVEAAYTTIDKRLESFDQVSGPGRGSATNPAIAPRQRLAVQDDISDVDVDLDILTTRIDALVLGHQLTYVGSVQDSRTYSLNDGDPGNVLPGVALPYLVTSGKDESTHEIRIASDPDADRIYEYTLGFFYDKADAFADVNSPGPLLSGAFGSPAAGVNLNAFDPRYQLPIFVDIDYLSKETSAFASITYHLSDATEVTAGLRHIWSRFDSRLATTLQPGLVAIPPAYIGPGLPNCAAAQLPSTYTFFCDVPIPATNLPVSDFHAKETPDIYNLSISHTLDDDLMIYAATGSSYRPPISSASIQGALAGHPDPRLNSLTFHPYETSTNYEAGFKWTGLDDRVQLNGAAFYQTFEDLTMQVANILYLNTAVGQPAVADMTASVDAEVTGIELDGTILFGNLLLSGQISYANGNVDGSQVPCNVVQNGAPVFNTEGLISLCSGGSVSREPLLGASLQGEYTLPLANGMESYVRALVSYNGENPHRQPNLVVEDYAITNLYIGLRDDDGGWEITGFVRNLFDTDRLLDRSTNAYDANTSLGLSFPQLIPATGSGYYATRTTPPREIGISANYSWGSR